MTDVPGPEVEMPRLTRLDARDPIRQSLGKVLLERGKAGEAEQLYREDLVRFPENGWSLFGLAASLRAQGKDAEAAEVQQRFDRVWQGSDVQLTASRF